MQFSDLCRMVGETMCKLDGNIVTNIELTNSEHAAAIDKVLSTEIDCACTDVERLVWTTVNDCHALVDVMAQQFRLMGFVVEPKLPKHDELCATVGIHAGSTKPFIEWRIGTWTGAAMILETSDMRSILVKLRALQTVDHVTISSALLREN